MASEVQDFLSSWKQFSLDDKNQLLSTLTQGDLNEAVKLKSASKLSNTAAGQDQIYQGVKLSCYCSYLYYYPTMHWTLDRTPETDKYWIGLFRKDAPDTKYLAHKYVGKAAQGSYRVGQINSTHGNVEKGYYMDEYELRMFRGDTRLNFAKTNEMRGSVVVAPTDPLASADNEAFEFKQLETDGPKDSFLQAIESVDEDKVIGPPIPKEDFHKKWNNFTPMQQQLLYPVLKHSCFPDEKKNPAPKLSTDLPEPKVRFSDLGKVAKLEHPEADSPNEIVLNITLGESYTYVFPLVEVTETVGSKYAFMGLYHIQSTLDFDPAKYIDRDWQYVGEGKEGATELNNIEAEEKGKDLDTKYLGVIFDYIGKSYVQLGYASTTIEAVISQADELPPADFKVDFNKEEALKFANLSNLAYEDYSEVQKQLPTYGLKAAMEINKGSLTAKTVGFIASNDTSLVVAFRGTVITSFRNLLTDAWARKGPISRGSPVKAHLGFVSALDLVYSDVLKFLKKNSAGKKLYITGHSLGGALASLLGYRLAQDSKLDFSPIQYVYGCPPVAEPAFAYSFQADVSNTITITGDPISTGVLIHLSGLKNLFKPNEVKYLPKSGGHSIRTYIKQLKKLLP